MLPLIPHGLCDTTGAERINVGEKDGSLVGVGIVVGDAVGTSAGLSVRSGDGGTATGTGTAPKPERSAWVSGRALGVSATEKQSLGETMAAGMDCFDWAWAEYLVRWARRLLRRKT